MRVRQLKAKMVMMAAKTGMRTKKNLTMTNGLEKKVKGKSDSVTANRSAKRV